MAHPGFSKGFVFDVDIIPSLNTVITSCPDHNLRREALGILRSMVPRHECIWDSKVCAEAGEKPMAMEDQRLAGDFIDPQIFNEF